MSSAADHNVEQPASFAFSAENLKKAEAVLAKYPANRRQSALMPLMDIAQRQHGWLPRAAMDYVADMLGIAPMKAYEVATFYTMYNLAPVGKYHVQVCTNLPCWLRGSDEVVSTCKRKLGIEVGETTADGKFTLSEVECAGACVNAPMMAINDDYFEDLDAESTESILTELDLGKTPKPGPQNGRKGCEPLSGLTSLTEDGGKA